MNLSLQKIVVIFLVVPVFFLMCCFIGCQKGIRVEMVEGIVTIEDKPVADADV
ncbi:MAG: hypothetical protein LBT09_15205 [Planctomycetaceae bacterium]|jgi:hypothetical protein|nr:hypothetical protein [Planctomycetaceae bacterium]